MAALHFDLKTIISAGVVVGLIGAVVVSALATVMVGIRAGDFLSKGSYGGEQLSIWSQNPFTQFQTMSIVQERAQRLGDTQTAMWAGLAKIAPLVFCGGIVLLFICSAVFYH